VHTIAVLALPDTIAFDLSTPVETFGRVVLSSGEPGYRVMVCGTEPIVSAGPMRIGTDLGIEAAAGADTIVVPGRNDVTVGTSEDVLHTLRSAYAAGTRIASICSGAFTLAEAGLLDGKRATTHWLAADLFRATFPTVDLDPDVLYVDEGQVLTSAGASAGLDLCLHMVRRDLGANIAASVARLAVMPLERAGGQAQFIEHTPPSDAAGAMTPLLAWMEANLSRELPLPVVARRAAMSTRTLSRRFREQVGTTPAAWIAHARVRRAQRLLETTDLAIEQVAAEAGFGSAAVMREHFGTVVGTSPLSYRRAFSGM